MQDKMEKNTEGMPFPLDARQLDRARAAKDADELMGVASEEGFTLTPEQAQDYYGRLHATPEANEIADEELRDVAGGCSEATVRCAYCHKEVPVSTTGTFRGLYYCKEFCLDHAMYLATR